MKSSRLISTLMFLTGGVASTSAALFTVTDGDFESGGVFLTGQVTDASVGLGWYVGDNTQTTYATDAGNTHAALDTAGGWLAQAVSTVDVTGEMLLKFDVKLTDVAGQSGSPYLAVSFLGETNPWNGSQTNGSNVYLNQNKEYADIFPEWPDADRASIAADPSSQPGYAVDLTQANGSTWTTFSYVIDMGTGFNHSQGGSAGDPVAYLILEYGNIFGWAGDSLSIDNVRFETSAIPEPSTWAFLLGSGALASAFVARRRRRG